MMGRRWLVVGLIVSVALNLFLIGAAAGVAALGHRLARQNAFAHAGALVRATRGLAPDQRHAMRQMLLASWNDILPQAEQSRALSLGAWTALGDPHPDTAAIKGRLAQARDIDHANRAQVEAKTVDYVAALPADQRAAFAGGMRRVIEPPAK